MQKLITRIASILLIPCMTMDPIAVRAWIDPVGAVAAATRPQSPFTLQALAEQVAAMPHPGDPTDPKLTVTHLAGKNFSPHSEQGYELTLNWAVTPHELQEFIRSYVMRTFLPFVLYIGEYSSGGHYWGSVKGCFLFEFHNLDETFTQMHAMLGAEYGLTGRDDEPRRLFPMRNMPAGPEAYQGLQMLVRPESDRHAAIADKKLPQLDQNRRSA